MLITLHRYILRELLKALGLALLVFGFVLLVVPVAQMLRDGVGIGTTLVNIPRMLPLISPMLLPLMVITGVLVCYGRFAGANELVAVEAGGINPFWLTTPALAAAGLATIITLYLNDSLLTQSTVRIRQSVLTAKTEILRRRLARPGSFVFYDLAFVRLPREGDHAGIDITFFNESRNGETDAQDRWDPEYPHQSLRFLARDHDISLLKAGDGDHYVLAELRSFQRLGLDSSELRVGSADLAEKRLKIGSATDDDGTIDPNRITYWGIQYLLVKLQERRGQIAEAKVELAALPGDGTDDVRQAQLERVIRDRGRSVDKYLAELHFKIAMSFACIAFALVGIPIGLTFRSERTAIGFAIGLAVAIAFFILIKGLQNGAKDGLISHALIWLPNLMLICTSAGLWWRIRRGN